MSGRQRRVCVGSVAGSVLAGCGRWAGRSGLPVVGLVLSVVAALLVCESAWRSGALRLPARRRPAGVMADEERSLRLLAAADRAFDT
ncbi:hypothetical protein [Streptomyces sp. NPDC096339]|uniref:hypothetical protein n=1 Tax=Streptomyces sp. NPDC096339 TaxID=3366086 RepID=UPI003810FD3B